jgi:hypothetical protein
MKCFSHQHVKGRDQLGDLVVKGKYNIKNYLKEVRYGHVDWNQLPEVTVL